MVGAMKRDMSCLHYHTHLFYFIYLPTLSCFHLFCGVTAQQHRLPVDP